jgi:hypothetical protein
MEYHNVRGTTMATLPYRLHPRIEQFFQEFVQRPFEEMKPSDAWVQHVTSQNWDYHTEMILDRGRADFSPGTGPLTPEEMVLLYCHYYMQMHTVSGYHVLQRAANKHFLEFPRNLEFIDFGCGPLTTGISLAWHHLTEYPRDARGVRVHYVGIDRSPAMLAQAERASRWHGLFHKDATFEFITQTQSISRVPRRLRAFRAATARSTLTVVLNCSYFFASHSLFVEGLIAFVESLLREHLVDDHVCLVYQNPSNELLSVKWDQFKCAMTELSPFSMSIEDVYYHNTIRRDWHGPSRIRLHYELLLNRKWKASVEHIPF